MLELVAITHHAPTALEGLAGLKEAGATAFEIFFATPSHLDPTDEAQVEAVRVAIQDSGMRAAVGHVSFGKEWALCEPDEGKRRAIIERHKLEFAVAHRLGVESVVVHPGSHRPEGVAPEALRENARKALQELVGTAGDCGLKIALENMLLGHVGDTLEELTDLVASMDSPVCGYCLDTGHAFNSGVRLDDAVRAFHPKLYAIHWQDTDGQNDRHWIPGRGIIPWGPFFSALDEVGFSGGVTVETGLWGMILPEFVRLGKLALSERRGFYV
jgi:sugar phosphate isomerase/epimerase